MKVMQIDDPGERSQPGLDRHPVHHIRYAIKAQMDRRFEEPECRQGDHHAHQDGRDRVVQPVNMIAAADSTTPASHV